MAGLVPVIRAAPLWTIFKIGLGGAACGRMLRIRLGMAGTSPAKTRGGCKDYNIATRFAEPDGRGTSPAMTIPGKRGGGAEARPR
jgi:hypothetical protein